MTDATITSVTVPPNGLIHSFVYAAWDNVVGPKVLKTWPASSFEASPPCDVVDEVGVEVAEGRESPSDLVGFSTSSRNGCRSISPNNLQEKDEVAKYISLHTLTGHLSKAKHTDYDSVNDVCLDVPALGFASQSITFYCLFFPDTVVGDLGTFCTEEPCMSSLSAVFYHSRVEDFWNLQPLILHLLRKTADRLKVGLSQDVYYYEDPMVTKWLEDTYNAVTETSRLAIVRPSSLMMSSIKEMLSNSQVPWDVVITSMLTTMGACCVVGKNEDYVNRVIDFLGLFLPDPQQLSCSRHAASHFSGGLYLQGLLEDANGARSIHPADILLNEFPLTLLDLTRKGVVKFTGHFHEHYRSRQRQSREQEFNIIQQRNPEAPYTTQSIFRSFGVANSKYVYWCLDDLARRNAKDWPRCIASFHLALARRAQDFAQVVHSKMSTVNNGETSLKSVRNSIKTSMNISDVDFWLLAATAERLKPGFFRIFFNYRIS